MFRVVWNRPPGENSDLGIMEVPPVFCRLHGYGARRQYWLQTVPVNKNALWRNDIIPFK